MMEILHSPWPWYVGGILIGLVVPLLLILGNKHFGISSTLSTICAACIPVKGKYQFTWKDNRWNLVLAAGVITGAILASNYLMPHDFAPEISNDTQATLSHIGVKEPISGMAPNEIFSWDQLFSTRGIIFLVIGGFLVGFGTRYANGCTSGHAIMGLSLLNLGSLVATIGFFIGGLLITHFVLPYII